MHPFALRLQPGADLRRSIESAAVDQGWSAAFVVAGIGSLDGAQIRLAGAASATEVAGALEILSLCGSVAGNGAHLHISVADSSGRVLGGHVAVGCRVRTTAEILLALLPEWHFERAPDAATGWAELLVRRS